MDVTVIKEREMFNFRVAHDNGDSEDEIERLRVKIRRKGRKTTSHNSKIKLTMRRCWTKCLFDHFV